MEEFAKFLAVFALSISTATAAEVVETGPMQSMQIGRAQLDVPSAFQWKQEAKGVLIGELPGSYDVLMSIVVHTIERNGKLVADAGARVAVAQGAASGATLQTDGAWYKKSKGPPPDAKQGAFVHTWYSGAGPHTMTITCVIDIKATDSEVARATLAAIPKMMSSLRTAD